MPICNKVRVTKQKSHPERWPRTIMKRVKLRKKVFVYAFSVFVVVKMYKARLPKLKVCSYPVARRAKRGVIVILENVRTRAIEQL